MMFRMFPYIILVALSLDAAFAQDPNTIFLPSSVAADTVKANQMNNSAHLRLGYKYLTGLAGTMDTKKAAQHFAIAAGQNVPAASAWLGYTYVVAPELGHAPQEGVALLQQAANAGDPVGQTLLGHLYQTGRGLPQNLASAKALFVSVGSRFALAQTYLGELLLASGDANDRIQASFLFQRAAGVGETKGMLHFANIQLQAGGALTGAAQGLAQAESRNDPVALYERGTLYRSGLGVEKSAKMAVYLYQRSANVGYAPAQAALGMCYATGTGVGKDLNQAVKWLTMAAPRDQYAARQLPLVIAQNGGH